MTMTCDNMSNNIKVVDNTIIVENCIGSTKCTWLLGHMYMKPKGITKIMTLRACDYRLWSCISKSIYTDSAKIYLSDVILVNMIVL